LLTKGQHDELREERRRESKNEHNEHGAGSDLPARYNKNQSMTDSKLKK
jgi:hypothetical protein